ncbi:S26 family signal peptidase [Candidatus Peregrinibacteria bacterium]|nr:MAG: S26 family signal peptidase [Candidatus Peregrinibacteria bacterium]
MDASIVKKADWPEKLKWLIGKRRRFKVNGNSMSPVLEEGETVYAKNVKRLSVGDIVIAHHPFKKSILLVKQIKWIEGQRVMLQGVNPHQSTDGRQLGLIRITDIVGQVTAKEGRPAYRGM